MIEMMDFLILGLATWRLSSLLVNERGLFSIFLLIRLLIGTKYTDGNETWGLKDYLKSKRVREIFRLVGDELDCSFNTELSKLFSCVWCVSVWIAFAFYMIYTQVSNPILYDVFKYISIILSLSAVAIIVEEKTK